MDIKIAALLTLATEHKPSNEVIFAAVEIAYEIDRVKTIQMLLYIRDKNN